MSQRRLVIVPPTKTLVKESPGFKKKHLSDFKLDMLALCEFGCRYCSSNNGNYLRRRREPFADAAEQQLGRRLTPNNDPYLMIGYENVVEHLDRELSAQRHGFGEGLTLMYSMLTDGFSPWLVTNGITGQALDLLLTKSRFRIRILTKNAVVGSSDWIEFFLRHRDRFVVGLSCGTLDAEWSRAVEIGTSQPAARLRALRALQDAGVATYGMMCPIFPDAASRLDELIEQVRPLKCETIWAEPFNDRQNWRVVRDGYAPGSAGHNWFTEVYETGNLSEWSRYATDLYVCLKLRAESEGWIPKLKYLLYEHGIVAEHARSYCDRRGLILQSPADEEGKSRNPHIRAVQEMIKPPSVYDRLRRPIPYIPYGEDPRRCEDATDTADEGGES